MNMLQCYEKYKNVFTMNASEETVSIIIITFFENIESELNGSRSKLKH